MGYAPPEEVRLGRNGSGVFVTSKDVVPHSAHGSSRRSHGGPIHDELREAVTRAVQAKRDH